jgi:hypothetical protein
MCRVCWLAGSQIPAWIREDDLPKLARGTQKDDKRVSRGTKLSDFVLEQLKRKPVYTAEEAHEKYVVVLHPVDYEYMKRIIWSLGERHPKGSQRVLEMYGFTAYRCPGVEEGKPRLMLREDAVAMLGEFAEGVIGL